jgi:hypothetical protein
MNDDYILEKLKKWVPLFYGKETRARVFKAKDLYCFGPSENSDERMSMVTKPIAIYLAVHQLPKQEIRKAIKRRRLK